MNESSACLEFRPEKLRDDNIYSVIPEVVFGDPKSSPGYRQNGFSSNRLPDFREVIQQKRLDSRPKDYGNDEMGQPAGMTEKKKCDEVELIFFIIRPLL